MSKKAPSRFQIRDNIDFEVVMETVKEKEGSVPELDLSLPYKIADISLADWGHCEM